MIIGCAETDRLGLHTFSPPPQSYYCMSFKPADHSLLCRMCCRRHQSRMSCKIYYLVHECTARAGAGTKTQVTTSCGSTLLRMRPPMREDRLRLRPSLDKLSGLLVPWVFLVSVSFFFVSQGRLTRLVPAARFFFLGRWQVFRRDAQCTLAHPPGPIDQNFVPAWPLHDDKPTYFDMYPLGHEGHGRVK